jgi:hypothetical protein
VERRAQDRRSFIGGSDARTIMGNDEVALVRLWREKRGEVEQRPFVLDLSARHYGRLMGGYGGERPAHGNLPTTYRRN